MNIKWALILSSVWVRVPLQKTEGTEADLDNKELNALVGIDSASKNLCSSRRVRLWFYIQMATGEEVWEV